MEGPLMTAVAKSRGPKDRANKILELGSPGRRGCRIRGHFIRSPRVRGASCRADEKTNLFKKQKLDHLLRFAGMPVVRRKVGEDAREGEGGKRDQMKRVNLSSLSFDAILAMPQTAEINPMVLTLEEEAGRKTEKGADHNTNSHKKKVECVFPDVDQAIGTREENTRFQDEENNA